MKRETKSVISKVITAGLLGANLFAVGRYTGLKRGLNLAERATKTAEQASAAAKMYFNESELIAAAHRVYTAAGGVERANFPAYPELQQRHGAQRIQLPSINSFDLFTHFYLSTKANEKPTKLAPIQLLVTPKTSTENRFSHKDYSTRVQRRLDQLAETLRKGGTPVSGLDYHLRKIRNQDFGLHAHPLLSKHATDISTRANAQGFRILEISPRATPARRK